MLVDLILFAVTQPPVLDSCHRIAHNNWRVEGTRQEREHNVKTPLRLFLHSLSLHKQLRRTLSNSHRSFLSYINPKAEAQHPANHISYASSPINHHDNRQGKLGTSRSNQHSFQDSHSPHTSPHLTSHFQCVERRSKPSAPHAASSTSVVTASSPPRPPSRLHPPQAHQATTMR